MQFTFEIQEDKWNALYCAIECYE